IKSAVRSSLAWLEFKQQGDGHWVGSVQSNATIDAEWILALWMLGFGSHPLRARLGAWLVETQRADGSWDVYHGACGGDVNATVEAYAALRSLGHAADAPHIQRARQWIFAKNALLNIRVFTRIWLALLSEWPWEHTPNVPPEVLVWCPLSLPFSIYNFSQWARATVMPISILSARRTVYRLPDECRLDELFPAGRNNFCYKMPPNSSLGFYGWVFRTVDSALHAMQTIGHTLNWNLLRTPAIHHVTDWIISHQEADGTWAGIQPPVIYSLLALKTEGFKLEHPVIAKGLDSVLNKNSGWRVDSGKSSFMQPTNSPVWDTIQSLIAFNDSRVGDQHSETMEKAVQWILDHQILVPGDWSVKAPNVKPGGWAFEYANDFYPDTDDTAMALVSLAPFRNVAKWKSKGIDEAIERGVNWLIGMQSSNGGWAAFDKDNNHKFLTYLPFCDYGEVIDPPSVDVTAHILEAFGKLGISRNHPSITRALNFIYTEQEKDGAWFGRWGVNYIYGTGAVLPALVAIGDDVSHPRVHSACEWLRSRQLENGGWGESCISYMDVTFVGRGTATASQTAWALMALVAVNRREDHDAIARGCRFLIDAQTSDGTWNEHEFTGTGFPGYGVGHAIKLDDPLLSIRLRQGHELSRAFMLRYDLYRHYFPVMALARCQNLHNIHF
ncbi:hypothetical protein HK100_003344, partial [Physocladia obscura]